MAPSAEHSSLFPIYILAMMALFLVPYSIHKLIHALSKKDKNIHCHCSVCFLSRKYQKTALKRISSFSTCSNLTIVLLWVLMAFLGYYVKNIKCENQAFEPFEVLGLKPGSSESEIKKAYRTLSRQYHPDKNPDPEAHKYFVEYITKAYQVLTDPISRENFEKYGHPDGRQGFRIGIALPQFLLSTDGSWSGIILVIAVVCILFPLVIGVIYLSRSSSYNGNSVMRQTLEDYYLSMKPFLAPSKVMEVFIKAAEYMEIPVRSADSEALQKLFTVVQTELGLDSKNTRQEQPKFWKRHPALTKAELLILAHLSCESVSIPLTLVDDFKHVVKLAPLLLEELLKMAIIRRPPAQYGWLQPALGVLELTQNVVQAVPPSARKAVGGFAEGYAPLMQLPHFSEESAKKLGRKKLRSFQELRDMAPHERLEILTQIAGLSNEEAKDVETVLDIMPSLMIEVKCETEGEEGGIQEGDIVTMQAWISLKRGNGLTTAIPHCPYFPFHKDENFWFFLADSASNDVWISQKVKFLDEKEAIASASNFMEEYKEESGVNEKEIKSAVQKVVEKLKSGSSLVMSQFEAPAEGTYNLTAYCICDSWIGCDAKTSIKLKVAKQKHTSTKNVAVVEDHIVEDESSEEETEHENDDYESEYSDDGEEDKTTKKKGKRQAASEDQLELRRFKRMQ